LVNVSAPTRIGAGQQPKWCNVGVTSPSISRARIALMAKKPGVAILYAQVTRVREGFLGVT
jgi:hypothetical protein